MERGHAEALAPMVETIMREARIDFAALDRIGVTTGPGTFTGQRVGIAFARALGVALKKPVIGVTTLDAMAEEALGKCSGASFGVAVADAKRAEVYLGARSPRSETLASPQLIALDSVRAQIGRLVETEGARVVLAGTAAPAILSLLQSTEWQPIDSLVRQPDAVFVAALAEQSAPGPMPKPLYLRPPDAKLPATSP